MPTSFLMPASFPARFSPELEQDFQEAYYARVIAPTLRLAAPFLAVLILAALGISGRAPRPYDLAVHLPQILFWSLIFGLTWVRGFGRVWQPVVVFLGWLAAALVLGQLAPVLTGEVMAGPGAGPATPNVSQQRFYFMLQLAVLLVSLAALRLPLRWAALLYGGVVAIGLWAYMTGLPATQNLFMSLRFAFLPVLLLMFVLLLMALTQEQLGRRAFLANHELEEERNDEKRKREQTETTLGVLNQAIGGIVHDLGNPLTAVQGGAQTLRSLASEGQADPEMVKTFARMIEDGAQMLNYLRLSLIEQSRVLEGKPTPLDLKAEAVRPLVEAGARYQTPRLAAGREVGIEGDDALQIHADAMKMVAVFMNLIGNALKYSDGPVRVVWRPAGQMLLIGVCDQGMAGRGITRAQAEKLFTAFGRLDTHAAIEGTGLGLLSVRKIVEAHGGEAFVAGYADGTPASAPFSTAAHGPYPSLLGGEWRTAFVVTCPLAAPAAHPRDTSTARQVEPVLR